MDGSLAQVQIDRKRYYAYSLFWKILDHSRWHPTDRTSFSDI